MDRLLKKLLVSLCLLVNTGCINSEQSRYSSNVENCPAILDRFSSFVEANMEGTDLRTIVRQYYSLDANIEIDELFTVSADGENDFTSFHELRLLFPRAREKLHTDSASCIEVTSTVVVLVSDHGFSFIKSMTYTQENGQWVISHLLEGEMFKTNLPLEDR